MNRSEKLDQLAAALIAAQKETGHVKATRTGNIGNKYADLPDVIDSVVPTLNRHGIAVIQSPGLLPDGNVSVTTMLLHTSGQWIEGAAGAPAPEPNKATNVVQMVGLAVRYLCRYALEGMAVVAERGDGDADSVPAPGQVRSLGTVPVTNDPGTVTVPPPSPTQSASRQADAASVAARTTPVTDATVDEAAEAGWKAGEPADGDHIGALMDEFKRLNLDFPDVQASLKEAYGVDNVIALTPDQAEDALAKLRAMPTPGGAS